MLRGASTQPKYLKPYAIMLNPTLSLVKAFEGIQNLSFQAVGSLEQPEEEGLGIRVYGLGIGVWVLEFGSWGFGDWGLGFR